MWDLCSKVNDLFSVNVWNSGTKKLSTDTNLTRQFQSGCQVVCWNCLVRHSTETQYWDSYCTETLCHGTRLSHTRLVSDTLVCLCLKCLSPTKGFCRNPHSGNSPTQLFSTVAIQRRYCSMPVREGRLDWQWPVLPLKYNHRSQTQIAA